MSDHEVRSMLYRVARPARVHDQDPGQPNGPGRSRQSRRRRALAGATAATMLAVVTATAVLTSPGERVAVRPIAVATPGTGSPGAALAPPTCDAAPGRARGPVRPARDPVVGAVGCRRSGDPDPIALADAALDLLQRRWARARPIPAARLDRCAPDPRPTSGYVSVTTARGQAVRLVPSPCGYLVSDRRSDGRDPQGPAYAVRVGFAGLGLADLTDRA